MGAPISPIVSGLLNAYSVSSLIQRQALAERQVKMQEERLAADQAMRDLEMAIRLPNISRPVNSGMVDAETQLDLNENAPAELKNAQATGMLPESVVAPRKADASRTIKYGDRQFELLTPEEIAMQDVQAELRKERLLAGPRARSVAAQERAKRLGIKSADMDARAADIAARGVDVPNPAGTGTIRVLPEEFSGTASLTTALNPKEQDNRTTAQKEFDFAKQQGYQGNFLQFMVERNKRQPVPGVDIPLPAAVEEQRKRMEASRAANADGLSPSQQSRIQVLASQFDNYQPVKNYIETANKAQSVKAIIDAGVGGPGDLAVVFEFMKGLDPTSVVRESEYASAAKSGNLFKGVMARFNGYFKEEGGFMPDRVKQDFLNILNKKLEVSAKQVKALHGDRARRIEEITGKPGTGGKYLTDYTEVLKPEVQPKTGGGIDLTKFER